MKSMREDAGKTLGRAPLLFSSQAGKQRKKERERERVYGRKGPRTPPFLSLPSTTLRRVLYVVVGGVEINFSLIGRAASGSSFQFGFASKNFFANNNISIF